MVRFNVATLSHPVIGSVVIHVADLLVDLADLVVDLVDLVVADDNDVAVTVF